MKYIAHSLLVVFILFPLKLKVGKRDIIYGTALTSKSIHAMANEKAAKSDYRQRIFRTNTKMS